MPFWRSTSPLLATLRLLPLASRRLSAAVVGLVVLTALVPAGFALVSGALVGAIGGTVAGGWGSPSGHRLIRAIAAVVALFVLQQVSGPGLRALADALGRRAEGRLRLRVMAATLGPPAWPTWRTRTSSTGWPTPRAWEQGTPR